MGLRGTEVTGEWRKLHNEELTQYLSGVISRTLRWAGHVTRIRGKYRCIRTVFWWRNLRERDHLEEPGVDESIILTWIFSKWGVGVRTGIDLTLVNNKSRAL